MNALVPNRNGKYSKVHMVGVCDLSQIMFVIACSSVKCTLVVVITSFTAAFIRGSSTYITSIVLVKIV